jgi:putative transposase
MKYFKTERETSFGEQVVMDLLAGMGDPKEDPLDFLFDEYRGSVKAFLEEALRAECDMFLGFDPYERGIGRADSRNGYYERDLESVFGLLEDLRIPRTRKGKFRTKLIEKYQRRQKQVAILIREMFVWGVSTRRVGEVLEPLLGIHPSATAVSRIAKSLDEEVRKYRSRPIADEYKYLILDGVTMKVKEAPHARKVMVLCAYGITTYGKKCLLAFEQVRAESETCCEAFLESLYRRGLEGENLDLIVTDGSAGLIRAVELVYHGVPRQRCWAHKGRNVAARLRRKNQDECLAGMKKIYYQDGRRDAIRAYREWEARWREEEPSAVECLAADLEELITFYSMPEHHWKKIRTTNLIERVFREVRRRTRPMTCFANKASCDRIIFAVFDAFNRRWDSRPIRHFTQKG